MKWPLLALLAPLLLSGCSTLTEGGGAKVIEGGAVYRMETPECSVEIISARSPSEGKIKIGKDCEIEAESKMEDALKILQALGVITQ